MRNKMKTVIFVIFVLFVSSQARVAVHDKAPDNPDISSNIITNDETDPKAIHIDLPTEKPLPKVKDETSNDIEDTTTQTICKHGNDISCKSDTNSTKESTPQYGPVLILTKYIKEEKLSEGREAARVDPSLFLGVESYSGFFTVNETYNSNMFFWYFPVEGKNVNETPWIIWLQGGPGASSMTGLFDGIGPFFVTSDLELKRNPHSWLKDHSLVFIDNPVGTGFSFTESEQGYTTDMDTYGDHLYQLVRQLVQIFPELRPAPLFVAGESYAGKYVPALGIRIHRNKEMPGGDINMQGLMVRNAYIDPGMISKMANPFYYFGLLEAEQIDTFRPLLKAFQQDIKDNNSIQAKEKWNHLIIITHQKHAYNFLRDDLTVGHYVVMLKKPSIMRALHVGSIKFSFVNMTVNAKLDSDFLSTAKPLYEELLEHYRILTYCGQLDQMLSCVCTSENYRTWRWNGASEFLEAMRFPYIYSKKLAGYHKSGGNLTEVVLRGAGHMAPLDAPAPAQTLVARWVRNQPLSIGFGLLEGSFVEEYVRNSSKVIYL